MKVLICSESEIALRIAGMALEAAGHRVVLEQDPHGLVSHVQGAAVLLVDAARAKNASRLLRDRGFAGRVLLIAEGAPAELTRRARSLQLDGAVAVTPPDDFARRVAAAVGSRRRVLIVDDSDIVASIIRAELESKGFEILYAPDAEKATSFILKRSTRPDLILLDVNMPKVDGVQFCRFVKKNEMFRSIKVIFCSGENKERVKKLVAECGADGFISKDDLRLGGRLPDLG